MQYHILVIEDDSAVGQSLCDGLEQNGFLASWKTCGRDGVDFAIKHNRIHSADIRLPDGSGF
jgi:DNA-binding response OmpR family regulator